MLSYAPLAIRPPCPPSMSAAQPRPPRPSRLHVAGLGCRRGCAADELQRLLTDSLGELGLTPADLHALATLDGKLAEPGLGELAARLGLPLHGLAAEELRCLEARLSAPSEAARRATGSAGVAEAAALALAERLAGAPAELLIAKRRSAAATFALARAGHAPASEHP